MKFTQMVLMFVLSFFFTSPAIAQPIKNFHQVTEGIYRGARPSSEPAIASLAAMGIKTVINLQGGDLDNAWWVNWIVDRFEHGESDQEIYIEKLLVERNGMSFFNFPMNSLGVTLNSIDSEQIEQILSVMNDPEAQPVFVHCAHGADRTGLIIALYRMTYQNWPVRKAYAEMRAKGHNLVHTVFTHSLDQYLLAYAAKLKLKKLIGIASGN